MNQLYFAYKIRIFLKTKSVQFIGLLLLLFPLRFYGQNVAYDVDLNDDNAFNRAIDQSKAVGATPGSAGVTPSGGASYSIPIAVPPGTNGLAPQLALTYNSQAGNGIAGYGWGVSGSSSIIRVQKNWYNDDKVVSPITLTNSDAFALDGQRLILFSGTNGASGAEYRTEIETFSKITKQGQGGFTVKTKEGITKEYGGTWDSRVLNSDGTAILEYKLNKIQDNFGNYMLFKYNNLTTTSSGKNGQNCLAEIHYTGNGITGQDPYNKVLFSYKVRYDKNTDYQGGTALPAEYVIDKVSVYGESNTLYKTYRLEYGFDGLYCVLNGVAEVGSDGSQLNSTIFKYGTTEVEFDHRDLDYVGNLIYDVYYPGDFNGDGFTDILTSSFTFVDGDVKYNNDYRIFKHIPSVGLSNSWELGASGTFIGNFNIFEPDQTRLRAFFGFNSADYDGDGSDDFITLQRGADNRTLLNVVIQNVTNNANTVTQKPIPTPLECRYLHSSGKFFYSGDFNGDSRTDYITILGEGHGGRFRSFVSFPALNHNNVQLKFTDVQLSGGLTNYASHIIQADKIYVIDFDGDGKSDLMTIKNDITKIYSIVQAGSDYNANLLWTLQGYPTQGQEINLGDFNGDKKTDILTKLSGDEWKVGYSTGRSFVEKTFHWGGCEKLMLGDFNGDGKTDVCLGNKPLQESALRLQILYSNGSEFVSSPDFYYSNQNSGVTLDADQYDWHLFDYNGDGQQDIFQRAHYSLGCNSFMFGPHSKKRLLEKVSDGLNEKHEFYYTLLTSASPLFYKRTMSSTFPVNVPRLGLYMVSVATNDNGIGGTNKFYYSYENALFHRTGRGFMGFQSTTQTNETMGTTTTQEYDLNTTFYATALKKTTTSLTGGQPISQTYNENEFKSLGGKRFYVKVPFAKERNILGGSTKFIYNVFDDNNGTILSTFSLNGPEFSNTTTVYTNKGVPFSTKPRVVTTTVSRGSSTATTITNLEYYNTGALKTKKELVGTDCAVTTNYYYYNFGGLALENTQANGLPTHSNIYTYEPKGRFPRLVTNSAGQTAEYTYHPLWGKALTYKGIDQLTTTYTYDGFGRMITAAMPQGYTVGTSYGWDVQNTRVYFALNTHPGRPDMKTWYDKLGRVVQQQMEGFNGTPVIATTQYDSKGNVFKKTQPHLQNGETILSSTYVYDAYNRLSNVITNTGASAYDYAYSSGNLTTTFTNEAEQITTQTTDPTGKVISATDPNGTLNYTYDGFGNILTVKSGTTVLIQNAYNNCGQQTQMTDKNAGTTNYVYNAYGQLKSQTTPIGFQKYTYNNLGQVLTKDINEGHIAYTYVTNPGGVNQVKTITTDYNNGYTHGQEFLYDAYSRPTTVKETIDGTLFSKTITYNVYDDPTKIVYNSGLTLNRQYDANGYLQNIKHGSTAIYTVNTMNGLGQCTEYALGNGKTSTTTYENGLPTHFYTAGIQDLRLGVDFTNGNITHRTDAIKGKTESFTYDDNERLLSAQVGNLPALTMTYANNGNINSKTDVGYYTYNSSKINALKKVSNPNTVVPNQAQNILYSSFSQPIKVMEHARELNIFYGADEQRRKSVFIDSASGNPIWARYYFGDYERQAVYGIEQTNTQNIHYINGLNGLACVATVVNENPTFHYTYTDHLGSILTVTDDNGTVEAEQNFDPWGRARNYKDWTYSIPPNAPNYLSTPAWLYRGFTGHEHLPHFNLVNMNGRLYDPLLARMLSPDNYVQDPFSSQSFNRYTYCLNNPLKYTDPSGEVFWMFGGGGNVVASPDAISGIGLDGYGGALLKEVSIERPQAGYGSGGWASNSGFSGMGAVGGSSSGLGGIIGTAVALAGRGNGFNLLQNNSNIGIAQVRPAQGVEAAAMVNLNESLDAYVQNMPATGAVSNVEFESTFLFPTIRLGFLGKIGLLLGKRFFQSELRYTQKQLWKKFGEHYAQYGLTHSEKGIQQYLQIAKDIYKNPAIKHTFPQGGMYAGETWFIKNGQLLRLDPKGNFRSLYPLKK